MVSVGSLLITSDFNFERILQRMSVALPQIQVTEVEGKLLA